MCIYVNRWTNHLTTIKEVQNAPSDKRQNPSLGRQHCDVERQGSGCSCRQKLF